MAYNRQQSSGAYGHRKQTSSYGGAYSSVPPLNVPDTLILHSRFMQQGIMDASKWKAVFETLLTNKVIQGDTLKCSVLQIIVLVSALTLKPLLAKASGNSGYSSSTSTSGIAYILFHALWLYPLSLAAIYYSGLVRASHDMDRRGNSTGGGRSDYRGLTSTVAGESYRVLILLNYFAVITVFRMIPFVGGILAFVYCSCVDSYYICEAGWLNHGISLEERIKSLDSRWAYYFGFGLPITLASYWSSDPVVNLSIFSLLYPFFSIMATSSIPQPINPDIPTSSLSISFLPQAQGSFSMAAAEGGEEARGRRGSPYVPTRIPLLFLADKAYGLLNRQFVVKKKDAGGARTNGGGGGYGGEAGWRGDHRNGTGGGSNRPPAPSAYAQAPTPYDSYGHNSNFQPQPTPPRKGHVATDSNIFEGGMPQAGGGGARMGMDKNMDKMISAAAKRSKRD